MYLPVADAKLALRLLVEGMSIRAPLACAGAAFYNRDFAILAPGSSEMRR
jgi:hypothetical protein